jgi:hypothetical protein
MSVLLYLAGAIATVAGAVMIAFGIPINEFSFGNTLIAAGVTTFMGGLVILGLGAVVAQLQKVVDALAARPALHAARPMETFEAPVRATAASRIPFPSRPVPSDIREPQAADSAVEAANDPAPDDLIAPTLHNPDEPPPVEDTAELPMPPRRAAAPQPGFNGSGSEKRPVPPLDAGWRAPPPLPPLRQQSGFFENMWPASERQAKAPPPVVPKYEPKPEAEAKPKYEMKREAAFEPASDFAPEAPSPDSASPPRAEPERVKLSPASDVRAVAILKSGVVDGMGYTLYVDGSIEAELPQGTLRFASIDELRGHLEKNS